MRKLAGSTQDAKVRHQVSLRIARGLVQGQRTSK